MAFPLYFQKRDLDWVGEFLAEIVFLNCQTPLNMQFFCLLYLVCQLLRHKLGKSLCNLKRYVLNDCFEKAVYFFFFFFQKLPNACTLARHTQPMTLSIEKVRLLKGQESLYRAVEFGTTPGKTFQTEKSTLHLYLTDLDVCYQLFSSQHVLHQYVSHLVFCQVAS